MLAIIFLTTLITIGSISHSIQLPCENFSGNWSGICLVNGEERKFEILINQTKCELITFGSYTYSIGKVITREEKDDFQESHLSLEARWAKDLKSLTMLRNLLSKTLDEDPISVNQFSETMISLLYQRLIIEKFLTTKISHRKESEHYKYFYHCELFRLG